MKTYTFFILIIAAVLVFGLTGSASAAPIGSVLDFDGNDYLTVADAAVLDQANQSSLSAWVKPDTTPAADGYIIYRANGYYLKQNTSNQIVGAIYYSSAFQTITSSALALGKWTHIELTYNKDGGGVDELKLYINGVLSAVADHSTAIADTNTALYIGCQNSTPTNCFDGKIDDFRLYQYARSADEVKTDYNNGFAAHFGKDSQRDDGLVGFWNMEEGKGQTVYDRSGNGNNGTLGGTAAVQKSDPVFTGGYSSAGAGGTALKFDGKDDYVITTTDYDFTSSDDFTIMAWVKPNGSGLWDYMSIAGQDNEFIIKVRYDRIMWKVRNTVSIYEATKFMTVLNDWYHLVGTRDSVSGAIKLYINGIFVESNNVLGDLLDVNNNFQIGKDYLNTGYVNGTIDEVRIYNRALSADEIRQHYNQKKPILELKMDEGSGTTTKDESFNNNDITLINTPAWLQGKFGSALNFTKTSSQYGYLADNASISLTKDLTISAWVKPASITAATLFDIAGKWDYISGTARESYLLAQYGDEIRLYIDAAANYKTTDNANLAVGNWYHIEGVYNATAQTVNIYVNGVLQTGTVTGTIPSSIGDDAGRFQIAAEDSSTAAANFYDGAIDEVRIYNYARTPLEILADYNNGLAAHLR